MLVRCLRASLLFVLLLFPALTFQSDLNGPNVQMVPARSREARPSDTSFPEPTLRVDSSLVLIPTQVTTREGAPILDLDYEEDSNAEADANFILTGAGQIVEAQATGEKRGFSRAEFDALMDLAQSGIATLVDLQKAAIAG